MFQTIKKLVKKTPDNYTDTGKEIVSMKEFVEFLAKHLVDKPEDVHVTSVKGESVTVYELRVGDGDMGKVIGKKGQTAQAIRTLLNAAAAAKKDGRAVLEILD